jgi:hypothetical protein
MTNGPIHFGSDMTPHNCPKEEGKKFDSEKNMLQLIEPEFEEGIGWVLTKGAKKYGVDNWKNFTAADKPRFIGAMRRHLSAYRKGEIYDQETGLSHLYHLCCEAMFADYFDRKQAAEDLEREERLEAAYAAATAFDYMNS